MTNDVQLSDREREILRLVATGATNQQIAAQLNISANTVKVHLRNIFGKIGVASRTEATVYAIRTGLIAMSESQIVVPDDDTADDLPPEAPPPDLTAGLPKTPLAVSVPELVPVGAGAYVNEATLTPRPVLVPRTNRLVLPLLIAVVLLTVALLAALFWPRPVTPTPVSSVPTASPSISVGVWRQRAILPEARSEFARVTYDRRLFTIGGLSPDGPTSTVQRYDPVNNVWAVLNDKPSKVAFVQAVVIGGRIYVPGGEDANGTVMATFEAYDPRSDQWEKLPPLPNPRSRYALASIDGRLYLFGGWDGTQSVADVLIYDPIARTWTEGTPMPSARRSAGAAVVEGRVYIVGGEDAQGAMRSNDRYDPSIGTGGRWESAIPLPMPVANPAVLTLSTFEIAVIDPKSRQAYQYNFTTDSWDSVAIPNTIDVSSHAVMFGVSIFLFGTPQANGAVSLSEYRTSTYTTFIPNLTNP
jgi:DNA-binding CsgD family transcriptional regulator